MLVLRQRRPGYEGSSAIPYLCIEPSPANPGKSNLMCDLPFGTLAMVVHRPSDIGPEIPSIGGWLLVLCNQRLGWLSYHLIDHQMQIV